MKNKQTKYFLIGLSVSLIVLFSFFLGGLADRVFVLKPLDYFFSRSNRISLSTSESNLSNYQGSSLRQMMQEGEHNVADVAQKASESVVTISIKTQQRVIDPSDIFGSFGFFGLNNQEPRFEEIQRDIGTGFVVDGGLIVTNKHVVGDLTAEFKVIDYQENEYSVTQIYRDPSLDLAILHVDNFNAPALALGNSDRIRVGEPVIAIGTALGQFRHTVTTGVISGVGRSITAAGVDKIEDLQNMLQTDAAINPGNSGGPLINSAGEVVGVNVATATADNISFAIPINIVSSAISTFNETGQFDRPMLGVNYSIISEQAALLNEVPQGAYVIEVIEGSVAEKSGIQSQDIIVEFDGEKITETQDLAQLINQKKVGSKVKIKIWRVGEYQDIEVTLTSNINNNLP